jgi:hypothetical protein
MLAASRAPAEERSPASLAASAASADGVRAVGGASSRAPLDSAARALEAEDACASNPGVDDPIVVLSSASGPPLEHEAAAGTTPDMAAVTTTR